VITAADASLHTPDSDNPMWAETNFFGFAIPEANMNGHIYMLFRPNQGVCLTTVAINSRRCLTPWDAEFADFNSHVPMGDGFDLQNYQLASGVKVRCLKPVMDYQVDYDDGHGTGIHFTWKALMPGYDIHDPAMDPMVAAGDDASKYAWGTAYNGHYDQTGAVEGEVTVDGRTIPFSSVAVRDHSWGPRPERHLTTLSWLNAHFDDGFCVHAMCDFQPESDSDVRFTHGYAIVDGQLIGLAGGGAKTRRDGRQPEEVVLELRSPEGRQWELHGQAQNAYPWPAWPNVVGFNALMRWECEGRTGYGEAYDFYGLQTLNRMAASR
jgi:hypothetical protein